MDSITKTRLTNDQVSKVIHHHYPKENILEIKEFNAGMFNATYYILGDHELKNGVVLKVGPKKNTPILRYEKDIIKTEVKLYHLFSTTSIHTPKIYLFDETKEIIDSSYFLMDYIDGNPWNKEPKEEVLKDKEHLLYELGRIEATIHTFDGPYFGYIKDDKEYQFDTWKEAFLYMMFMILQDGKDKAYHLPYQKIENVLQKNKHFLDDVKKPILIDFDMWAGNIFIKKIDNIYNIVSIVDFERAFYGDPLAEFVGTMMISKDLIHEPSFLKGYEEVSQKELFFGESETKRMDLYLLYMMLLMNVETYRYPWWYRMMMKIWTTSQMKKIMKRL